MRRDAIRGDGPLVLGALTDLAKRLRCPRRCLSRKSPRASFDRSATVTLPPRPAITDGGVGRNAHRRFRAPQPARMGRERDFGPAYCQLKADQGHREGSGAAAASARKHGDRFGRSRPACVHRPRQVRGSTTLIIRSTARTTTTALAIGGGAFAESYAGTRLRRGGGVTNSPPPRIVTAVLPKVVPTNLRGRSYASRRRATTKSRPCARSWRRFRRRSKTR